MNLTKTRNTTKYLAIKELSDENKTYSISALCEFAGIARSAYYKWLGHVNSDNDNLNERIDFWIFPLSTIWGAYQKQGIPGQNKEKTMIKVLFICHGSV